MEEQVAENISMETHLPKIHERFSGLMDARHHDPHQLLGLHQDADQWVLRLMSPHTKSAWVCLGDERLAMTRVPMTDIFELQLGRQVEFTDYRYETLDDHGATSLFHDPYRLMPILRQEDLYLFNSGAHHFAYKTLGGRHCSIEGVPGVLFATWAPNAERVSIVGDFNRWDGRSHPMRSRGVSGVWELFIPELEPGEIYKYEIRNRHSGEIHVKMDPFGRQGEMRPATASIVPHEQPYDWSDELWMQRRSQADWLHEPVSIYEVHLGSWMQDENGEFLDYKILAEKLVAYVQRLGYTHVQLMPISEHPFDGSWGYQVTGYFSPTSRFGSPEDFAYFVDYLHRHHIGVFLDWVPAHFPKDAHGLARFDGSALYEHEDPLLGEHKDWGTLIFNYGRSEVKSFLISSALYWLEEFHIDGLRVDAVASMLYLDYSREEGEWRPNQYGGNENLEAIDFIRTLNEVAHERFPGTFMMAEESTAWPMVSHPIYLGGLGYSMKWNMGWMNDTLEYMSLDPVYRQYHHDKLTFAQLFAFTENFILPLSHDEVVHLKHSLLSKMPGDQWQQFANLRLLMAYMFTQPGKKLLFMGADIAQYDEWDHETSVQWDLLKYPYHQGIQNLVADLNRLYTKQPALHQFDFDQRGFEWIDCHDSSQSVLSYERKSEHETVIVLLNFTPMKREKYRIGVDELGYYQELLNTDAETFGGSNTGNAGGKHAMETGWGGKPYSLELTLPPLGALVLKKSSE